MNDLAHWQDDSNNALGGEFDGSLSGFCIMSLSFDFSKNGPSQAAPVFSQNKDSISASPDNIVSQMSSRKVPSTSACTSIPTTNSNVYSSKSTTSTSSYQDRESMADSGTNCFKRFKSSIQEGRLSDINHTDEVEDASRSEEIRHQKGKQHKSSMNPSAKLSPGKQNNSTNRVQSTDTNRSDVLMPGRSSSPNPSEESCHQASSPSISDESSRSPPPDTRSLTPSSLSSSSHSSRSSSPEQDEHADVTKQLQDKSAASTRRPVPNDSYQVSSLYSQVRDNVVGGSGLKESSHAASVITTTAPIHFKTRHHPLSLKQFPMSPYHQFSNSSFNPDMYDKYLSLDSHPPLQTPLIGIERTQDLLQLRLPPHGPDDFDSQRFPREWLFEESRGFVEHPRVKNPANERSKGESCTNAKDLSGGHEAPKTKETGDRSNMNTPKGFPFNYKSNSNPCHSDIHDQHEPIDLNISYDHEGCYNNQAKSDTMFNQSMKHFNPDKLNHDPCYDLRSKQGSPNHNGSERAGENNNSSCMIQQYHSQESMFGIDSSKQKFQYILSAPISVATKLNEDTMTYLNQAQAYEIKLENITDVSEAKKGFMCSIINIGFHERHMQQAENELWQQWSQQHPNEKIFSVDMKLSYNVFGVESDGLNKYEFLWDSSKAAGVFIRINSISTEFTLKKHGGEKGVPFKLSIETFSYNSKTHDSYFISAACCQIKVFKPKGAERKCRSDRDKFFKKPASEQNKYHRSLDYTIFRDCSLTSLHPFADRSDYYRHSHGHFASKQGAAVNIGSSSAGAHHSVASQSDEENERCNNTSQRDNSPETHISGRINQKSERESATSPNSGRDYHNHCSKDGSISKDPSDQLNSSKVSNQCRPAMSQSDGNGYDAQGASSDNTPPEVSSHLISPSNTFNQMYSHHTSSMRSVASFAGINNTQHFGMAYYSHTLPTSLPPHITQPINYCPPIGAPLSNIVHQNQTSHPVTSQDNTTLRSSNPRSSAQDRRNASGSNHKAIKAMAASNQACHSYTNQTDHPAENHSQDMKDATLPGTGGYVNDHFEPQSQFSNNSHFSQQSYRQPRSSGSHLHTSAQNSAPTVSGSQNRHLDGYVSTNSAILESAINTNHWIHGASSHAPLASPITFGQRHASFPPLPHQNTDGYPYNNPTNQSVDHSGGLYESEPNSHQRNSHAIETDGCSRLKGETPCGSEFTEPPRALYNIHITVNSNCVEVLAWLTANRFGPFIRAFNNFSGADLLRLSKTELIEICGLSDGIRLNNCLHNQPIKPRKTLYICVAGNEIFHPIYLYTVNLSELLRELSRILSPPMVDHDSPEKNRKTSSEFKSGPHSGSSSDSRSSVGVDDLYPQSDRYYPGVTVPKRSNKLIHDDSPRNSTHIERLLIDGLTSVKIVATEQVVQMLENDSVWTLTYDHKSGISEACITVCNAKKSVK